ncbi:MAG: hypothetical protein KDA63_04705 [Planctomycetales bacterium]|nr:hypothetical protein [Planctomycetales bacterium]
MNRHSQALLCSLTTAIVLAVLQAAQAAAAINDLIVFGDSLSDVGNISSATFGTQPGPYYYDGRVSNGPVYAEYLSGALGLGPLTASSTSGDDFAYGGAQTSGTAGLEGFFIRDVDEQVDVFLTSRSATADTLYTVFAGANDIVNGLTDMSASVGSLASDVERLIAAGARQFLVPNLPRLGTVPRFSGDAAAAATATALSESFNAQLAAALDGLETSWPTVTFIRFDTASLFEDIMANPAVYGFANVTDPAAAGLSVGDSSYDTNLIVAEPNTYLFWDELHPTTFAHEMLAEKMRATVLAALAVPGDGNQDGHVDGLDYLLWAGQYGDNPAADPPGPPTNGDFNGDSVVDGLDYLVWAGHFRQGTLDSAAIPEPGGVSLLLVSGFLLAANTRLYTRRV